MKKTISITSALVLLFCGTFGVFSSQQAFAGGGGGASKEGGVYRYVELEPLVLPIVDKTGVSQTVSLVIALEVKGADDHVRAMAPRLTDAYIQDLYGMLNEHAALKGGVIQVGYIKERLNKISQGVIPDGKINDVLLQVVQQRPI